MLEIPEQPSHDNVPSPDELPLYGNSPVVYSMVFTGEQNKKHHCMKETVPSETVVLIGKPRMHHTVGAEPSSLDISVDVTFITKPVGSKTGITQRAVIHVNGLESGKFNGHVSVTGTIDNKSNRGWRNIVSSCESLVVQHAEIDLKKLIDALEGVINEYISHPAVVREMTRYGIERTRVLHGTVLANIIRAHCLPIRQNRVVAPRWISRTILS